MLSRRRPRAVISATRKQKVVYWVVTALFLLPMAGSGVPEFLFEQPASTVTTLIHLGYPLYLMRILGLAKVLGAIAIVSGRSRTLKEWAYAGYTFDLLGAIASHLIVGDGPFAAVPAIVLALVLTSYLLWSRVVVTSSEPVKSQGLPPAGLPLMAVSDRDDP
jgi:DoxX-like family